MTCASLEMPIEAKALIHVKLLQSSARIASLKVLHCYRQILSQQRYSTHCLRSFYCEWLSHHRGSRWSSQRHSTVTDGGPEPPQIRRAAHEKREQYAEGNIDRVGEFGKGEMP
jgi:hypothetical protein